MVDILAAPFDGGGARLGSRLGPMALQLAGLVPALTARGLEVRAWKSLDNPDPATKAEGLRAFGGCLTAVEQLKAATAETLERGDFPLVLGGEHSIAMGCIAAALEATQGDLAVLWIDAHADANVPGGSPTGSLHGMPIGALAARPSGTTGLVDLQWQRLIGACAQRNPLRQDRIAWLGLRDCDPAECDHITSSKQSLALTMHDIDRHGLVQAVERFDAWMRLNGAAKLWISFDVDVLDPILAPGTGTAVRGGLTYREGHLLAELLREKLDADGYDLVGLDVVEVNPTEDHANSTAKIVVEWIASLFGKTILGGSPK